MNMFAYEGGTVVPIAVPLFHIQCSVMKEKLFRFKIKAINFIMSSVGGSNISLMFNNFL